MGRALAELGLAAAPRLEAWRGSLAPAVIWGAKAFGTWASQPLALGLGEDEVPILPTSAPGPDAVPWDALQPADRASVTDELANLAGGLPEPPSPAIDAVSASLLTALCDSVAVNACAAPEGTLHARLAARSGPLRRPRTVAVEAAFAVLPLIAAARPPAYVRALVTGNRLAMPTAQGALATLDQLDAQAGIPGLARLDAAMLADGSDGEIAARFGFDHRSPLAWYLLREAETLGEPGHLGPLGSRILAEAVVGLAGSVPVTLPDAALEALSHLWAAAGRPGGATLS